MKVCNKCQAEKQPSRFCGDICINCYNKERDAKQRIWDKANPEEPRHCNYCNQTKLVKDFTPAQKRCKKCCCDFQLRRRESDLNKDPESLRICSKCHAQKAIREFVPGSWCKECHADNRCTDHLKRPEQYLLNGAKYRSNRDGIPINITINDICIPEFCPDLGIPLAPSNGKVSPNSPTLDKIIPELGYVKGNVRVISSRANRMKQETTLIECSHIWSNVIKSIPSEYVIDNETKNALHLLSDTINEALNKHV
jgi:hypothetical protein